MMTPPYFSFQSQTRSMNFSRPRSCRVRHALEPRHDVLQDIVQGVPHMEHACHIGGWYDNAKRLLVADILRPEKILIQPVLIPPRFGLMRLIGFAQRPLAH
jgi:hypothetical protein